MRNRHQKKKSRTSSWIVLIGLTLVISACSQKQTPPLQSAVSDSLSYGILIPQTATLVRSGEVPHNPMNAPPSDDSATMKHVIRGFRLFMNTSQLAPSISGNALACNNCHPNGGQRDRALPLVGIAKAFPEYNKRSGRIFSLEDRIVGCLLRSINASGNRTAAAKLRHENELEDATVNAQTQEVKDIAAYLTWLSSLPEIGKDVPWRGRNSIPASSVIPLNKLNPAVGKGLFMRVCSTCHGKDGQGVDLPGGKRPGPLWGPKSWNDGAGAARTYTLAGMIRRWMPYLNPGMLSDEQAQQIAAYITSQPRPEFPFKDKDYRKEKIPVDAVYYKQLYSQNPLLHHHE